ncbi:MAG: Tim44 domain-containing protein [Deltaproteobacteria bacterium]|nr:Tim44 domain-containing protein [Deltaproteobacteria bacterium]
MTPSSFLRGLVPLLVVGFVALSFDDAAARAGRGRSFGSRGTSSYRSPAQKPAPSYDSRSARPSSPTSPASPLGASPPSGFLRGLAGGLLGGVVGGMLFRSLGFAGPGAGVGGGGMGLFDIALLAGGAYLLYRFVAARRRAAPAPVSSGIFGMGSDAAELRQTFQDPERGGSVPSARGDEVAAGLSRVRQFDPSFDEARFRDAAQDIFFRVQGAWTRRDLAPVEAFLGDEVRRTLQDDLDELKGRGEVNRLENIAVREAEIVEAWQDQGQDMLTLRLLASLLDYTTDETGSVQAGSDREPVKFEEYWTFARPTGVGPWTLTAIQQA